MKTYKKLLLAIMAFLVVLTTSFFIGKAVGGKGRKVVENNYAALLDSVSRYQVKIGGLLVDVYEKGQLILTQKEALRLGLVEKDFLKKLNLRQLNQITELQGRVAVLMDSIKHGGQVVYVPVKDSSITQPAILLPFSFKDSTEYYRLYGRFDERGNMSAGFNIPPFKIRLVSGTDSNTGMEKISVIPSNKYIVIDDLQSVDIPRPKERIKRFGIGVSVGVMTPISPPYKIVPGVGVTLNYNFIRF